MASLNQVNIIGYVGDDPKNINTQTQRKMVSLSVGTTEKGYTTKDNRVIPDKTEWHSVVAFGKLAEIIEKYIRKGSLVFIQGKISTRTYEKDGVKRYVTEIIADEMQMLDRKPNDAVQHQAPSDAAGGYGYPPASIRPKDELGGDLPF